jgi:hypothetical protein
LFTHDYLLSSSKRDTNKLLLISMYYNLTSVNIPLLMFFVQNEAYHHISYLRPSMWYCFEKSILAKQIKDSIYLFQRGINTNGQEKMLWYILTEPFTSCKKGKIINHQ